MTPLLHNGLLLIAVAGFLLGLRHATLVETVSKSGQVKSPAISPSRLGLLAACLMGLLLFLGALSALQFRGDNFGKLQLLIWTVFLQLPLLLSGVVFLLWRRAPLVAWGTLVLVVLLVLIAIDAFLIEPHWLEISHITLTTPKVQQSLRIVVLADIQTDRPGAYEERVLRMAMAEQPDLVLLAGDYIQMGRRSRSDMEECQALNAIMDRVGVDAPLGVYAVQGNVDRPGVWPVIFAGLPITTFETTAQVDVGPAVLTALGMQDAFDARIVVAPHDKFHVVLGHSPNFSLGAVNADLLIAGHTHGGQVQLPFIGPLMTLTVAPRAWASGVTTIAPGKMLVVSRGIGMERANAPRLRFLCRPEVVVIDVIPAD
ncbi:MAG: metallophosphoesterase [Anaerolineae bacterium]